MSPADWEACEQGLECAAVTVPLDHDRPAGDTIDLALIRVPADDPTPRGSIFINFGGPGAAAVSRIEGGFRLDNETMNRYHLVGFDPRGVGDSMPLTCGDDLTERRPDLSPDADAERRRLDDEARAMAQRCERLHGELLPHLHSTATVRDLDLLRQAVGDDRMRYVGFSYGTYLGLRYRQLFPDLVDRMVLDGVVDPTLTLTGLLRQQAEGFERVFDRLDQACGAELACPPGGVAAAIDRLMADLELEATGSVGPTELDVAVLMAMYSERLWPGLAAALGAAEDGDLSAVERLHDRYVTGVDFAAYLAVICTDLVIPVGPDGWDGLADELTALSPRFGPALANELRACAHWPVSFQVPPAEVAAAGTEAPVLILSTTGDAATPVANALAVGQRLPGSGLVLLESDGHTAYGRSFCVSSIVADYLDSGRVPDDVHRC